MGHSRWCSVLSMLKLALLSVGEMGHSRWCSVLCMLKLALLSVGGIRQVQCPVYVEASIVVSRGNGA